MRPSHYVKRLAAVAMATGFLSIARADFVTTDPAQTVLGQATDTTNYPDNAPGYPSADSLYFPRNITACGNWMFSSDHYNRRVIGYFKNENGDSYNQTAELVLGKPDFNSNYFSKNETVGRKTLNFPTGIHCDGENLFVADTNNNRVLIYKNAAFLPKNSKEVEANIVLGQSLFDSSSLSKDRNGMYSPQGVWKTADKVFVADTGNDRIIIFSTSTIFNDPDGMGIAPDVILGGVRGTSKNAFNRPAGVYSDGTRLLVADTYNDRILYWATIPTTDNTDANLVLGQPNFTTGGDPTIPTPFNAYTFEKPMSLTYANGQLLVADHAHSRISAFDVPDLSDMSFWDNKPVMHPIGQATPNGSITTPTEFRLNWPTGVFSPSNSMGTYYIADYGNHRLVKYTQESIRETWGQNNIWNKNANRGPHADGLTYPYGVAVGKGKTFVVDSSNNRVLVFDTESPVAGAKADHVLGQNTFTSVDLVPTAPSGSTLFGPQSATVDEDRLYVSDSGNNRVLYWNLNNPNWDSRPADGVIGQTSLTTASSLSSQLAYPTGIYSDGKRLFVADTNHHRIVIWKIMDGWFSDMSRAIILGQINPAEVTAGTGVSKLWAPQGVYSDGVNLYVADTKNNRVMIWENVETLATGKSANRFLATPVDGCSDTVNLSCLSNPYRITGDGTRLFVSQYSINSKGDPDSYGRVLEWDLPIRSDNQPPKQKLWGSTRGAGSATSLTTWGVRDVQLIGNDFWVADGARNRVMRFSDSHSTYVDLTVSPRTVPDQLAQKEVVPALDFKITHVTGNHSLRWQYLRVQQEGGLPGDIDKIFLCQKDAPDCATDHFAELTPSATPGLFEGEFMNPIASQDFMLAYHISPTAKVNQSVGLTLHVNGKFFGFWDTISNSAAFISNIAGPSRTSDPTKIQDSPDTLILTSAKNVSISSLPQNIYVPFLEFKVNADEDQLFWEKIKGMKTIGTSDPTQVKARITINGAIVKDEVSFDANGTSTASINTILNPTVQIVQILLKAGTNATGTLGIEIDPALNPFVVTSPDIAPTFAKLGSAIREIISHSPNTLNIGGMDLVSPGQTAEQATRVVLGTVTLSTNPDWTFITRWPITRLGVNAPNDVENFEFWKDDGDKIFDSEKDTLVAQAPQDSQAVADIHFNPELRIDTTPTTLWVTVKLTANASPGNRIAASLDTIFLERDPNTTPSPSNFSLQTSYINVEPSHDRVSVSSLKLPKSLGQGDRNRDLLQLKLETDKNTAEWQSLTVTLGGTAVASDIKNVYLYRQEGANRTLVAQNKFTGTEATLAFSQEEILTTSLATYFLSVDVEDLAVDGHEAVLSLAAPAAVKLKQRADTVSSDGFVHATASHKIERFTAQLTLAGTSPTEEPREVEIGQDTVFVARLTAQVDKSYADMIAMHVHLSGAGSEASDLVRVALFRSNGDDVLNDADQFLASAPVVGGVADILLGSERVGVNPVDYLIGVDLSVTASPGDELVFGVNGTDVDVFSPALTPIVSNAGGFKSQALIVKEPITSLVLSNWTSLAPAEAFQTNNNVEMAAFQVRMNGFTGQWRSLRLDRITEANFLDSDVKVARLYRDIGTKPGHFDAQDKLVAETTFVSGSALLNFSAANKIENLTTTPAGYVLTVDVAGNAKPTNTIGFQLSSAGNFDLSPDGVDNTGFPFQTNRTVIRPTIDALDLTNPGTVNVAPLKITQGDGPIPFLRFNLSAETNQVTWQGLTVESAGTLLDSDITQVRLYEDLNGNGIPEFGEDVTRGQPSFNQHIVTLRPTEDVLVPISSFGIKKYLVTMDIARLAHPGATVKLKINELLVETPDFVQNAGNLGIGNPNESIVGDLPDTVTPTVESLANLVLSPTLYQGAPHAPVLRFRLRTNEDTALWTALTAQLTLNATSPLKPEHFTAFELFKDADGSGQLDSAESGRPLAVGTRLGQEISFTLATPEVIPSAGMGYFLAVSVSLDAPAGEPFSLTLKDTNAIKIASPDKLQWLTALDTPVLKVRNVKAPSTPVIADYDDPDFAKQDFLGGVFTPPDTTGRGQFTPSAIQFSFTWGSEMVQSHGDIGSADYCVGTTPGDCNTHTWVPLKPHPGVALATGLNLAHGATYYVSVRAKSAQYGALSDVGVSNGIIVDLSQPKRPVTESALVEATGYSLLWQPVAPTLSGLPGYIIEERTDAHPTWKPVPVARAGLARPELTTDGLSHTLVDKKPGTYFYRVTAVNGVGTKSEPSAAVRVDYALDQAQSFISENVNYPNPFDAKNGSTLITYILKEPSDVQVRFYDGFGREVRENTYAAGSDPGGIQGSNRILWDGTDGSGQPLPQGTYTIRLNAGGEDVRWKIGVWR